MGMILTLVLAFVLLGSVVLTARMLNKPVTDSQATMEPSIQPVMTGHSVVTRDPMLFQFNKHFSTTKRERARRFRQRRGGKL